MPLAIIRDGVPAELAPGADVVFQVEVPAKGGIELQDAVASWATVVLWSIEERASRGIHAIVEVEATPGAKQKLGPAVLAWDGKTVTATRSAVDLSADEIANRKVELKAYAGAARWNKEQGGITVGGVAVATNDASQRKISELRRRVAAGEVGTPFGFKAVSGWVDVSAGTIQAIDLAVAGHVQACYLLERAIDAAIDAGEITTAAAVDAAFAAG